jgi:amino acid adenylation domain-containing protein
LESHDAPVRDGPLVHDAVAERAREAPDALAITGDSGALAYGALDQEANRLARHLRSLGVGPEAVVAVHLERSPDLAVAVLATLRAGGAYLPLDPAYPAARLRFMLEDSGAQALVSRTSLLRLLPAGEGRAAVALDEAADELAAMPADPLPPTVAPSNLAYLVYTSGSTGVPKGVLLEHVGLLNLCRWHVRAVGLTTADRVTLMAPLGFDASVWELWPVLVTGACGVMVDETTRTDVAAILHLMRQRAVTVAWLPTALTEVFLAHPGIGDLPLRVLFTGGDTLRRRPRPGLPFRVLNGYGPAEVTVTATAGFVADAAQEDGPIPIGGPIDGLDARLLDRALRPVADGAPGEIHLTGRGVGRGYRGRPDLTAERFLPDPEARAPGARMYRTGDLARRRPDGQLEFLGREDRQVQLRGHRIELDEVERTLLAHPAVRQVAVTEHRSMLVAHVVAERDWLPAADLAGEQLAGWRQVLDRGQTEPVGGAVPETAGWSSTYTGLPIPDAEMHDWLRTTLTRLRALRPATVLEVGCGTGMLLRRLAPECREYVGVDFAPDTLTALRERLAAAGGCDHVRLVELEATELGELPRRHFDTVVLNSVVAYFTELEHLLEVLEQAVEATRPGGSVFVGDVRSLPLLPAFHASVELSRAPDELPVAELRDRVVWRLLRERELVVSPALFTALPDRLPRVTAVEVSPKHGPFANEMTAFRYDAVLRVEGPPARPLPVVWRDGRDPNGLRAWLAAAREPVVGATGIPNAQVVRHVRAWELASGPDAPATAGELRERTAAAPGIAPLELLAIAERAGNDLRLSWAAARPDGSLDAVRVRRTESPPAEVGEVPFPTGRRGLSLDELTNVPMRAAREAALARSLRAYLWERLPSAMVPGRFVVLDELPLSPAGKVDRNRLPSPLAARPEAEPAVGPRTPAEALIARAAAELLQVDRVGVLDDLTALGAHSLTLTQLAARIGAELGVELPLRLLFAEPTIAGIAARLGTGV